MRTKAILFVLATALLAGCGSGGSSTPSPYQGSWAGLASIVDGSGTGSGSGGTNVVVMVDSKGRLTGSWQDVLGSGTLSGSVTNGGTLTLNIIDAGSQSTATTARGVTAIAGSGNWQGSLPVTSADLPGSSIVFEVARQ